MDDDETFNKYKAQNEADGATIDAGMKINGEACWKWMTSTEAQEMADRKTPLIQMVTKELGDELEKLLGKETKHFMVPGSTEWEERYAGYVVKLKAFVDKRYSTELCEDPDRLRVNQTIKRKIEWVTMKHRGRQEQPFPLLSKSLLPRLADILCRVQHAIAEVSGFFLED